MLYFSLRPVWLYHIFPTLSHELHDFRENVTECELIFCAQFVGSNSHYKDSARYHDKCTQVFTQSTRVSCQLLRKVEFSQQFF